MQFKRIIDRTEAANDPFSSVPKGSFLYAVNAEKGASDGV